MHPPRKGGEKSKCVVATAAAAAALAEDIKGKRYGSMIIRRNKSRYPLLLHNPYIVKKENAHGEDADRIPVPGG